MNVSRHQEISLQIARDPRHDMLSRFFVINSIINERNIEIMLFLQRKHLRPCPHHAGGIWKRKFHCENASNVLRPHYAGGIEKRKKSPIILDLCLRRTSHVYRNVILFEKKAPLSKCFPFTRKRKAVIFKFLRFNEHFRKASFSWRISADGRPNRNKSAFPDSSGVGWTRPKNNKEVKINCKRAGIIEIDYKRLF